MRASVPVVRVALLTLGCAKNTADTDLLAGQILQEGMEIVSDPHEADAMIVNTCAFLTEAQEESIEAILQMAEIKRSDPTRRLVVVGCLAQRHGCSLLSEIPEIDLLVGPGEVHTLAPRLRPLVENGGSEAGCVRLGGTDSIEEGWEVRVVSPLPHSAYVKISEGCSQTCSFCIIPKLRGDHRSRSRESILREVRHLAAGGVREINLVAQELTSYGIDRYGRPSLADLLEDLETVSSVDWIRLLYTHPTNWSDRLLAAVRDLGRVVPYIDMPIQHTSDRILRAMRRPAWPPTRELLENFQSEIPTVAVRTTVMTGFPGETDREFEEMLAFVVGYGFDALGVFTFSPEEGTDACSLDDPVGRPLAQERRGRILVAQAEVSRNRNRKRIGQVMSLLVDAVDQEGVGVARHAGQAPEVDGVTRLRGERREPFAAGDMVLAEIVSADAYDLEARPTRERKTG